MFNHLSSIFCSEFLSIFEINMINNRSIINNSIHKSFKHGKNCKIGYFCVIEEDVIIGDNVDIQKATINAARDVGVAYGNNQPKTIYKTGGWW